MAKLVASSLLPLLLLLVLSAATLALSYNTEWEKCKSQCRREQDPQQRHGCMLRCRQQYRGGHEGSSDDDEGGGGTRGPQSRKNPFLFDEQSFSTAVKDREGNNYKILERFSQRSNLLRGIENYRVAVLEANPNTALVPSHCDSEEILFVVAGSATITLLQNENRETHDLRRGDILKLQAGTTVYVINNDNNEKLFIVELLETISTPGRVQAFFGIGGQNQESFFTKFSKDILEAAFNTQYEKVRRVFGENQDAPFLRVSQKKIREIKQQASSSSSSSSYEGGHGQQSRGPFNLFQKRPTYSNQHGHLHDVDANDYQPLRDQDISVSFASIRRGSMFGPHYNSKATKVAVVVDGKGRLEIASPYLSDRRGEQREQEQEQQEQEGSVSYRNFTAQVSDGQVYVVLPGHPAVIVADQGQDLRVLWFKINAQNNEEHSLAGRDNVYNSLNKAEREVFFKASEQEVEQVMNAQKEAGLFQGPQSRREGESEGHGGRPFQSILNFAGF